MNPLDGIDPTPWTAERETERTVMAEQWWREHRRILARDLAEWACATLLGLLIGLLLHDMIAFFLAPGITTFTFILVLVWRLADRHATLNLIRVDVDGMLHTGWGLDGHALVNPRSPMPPAPDGGTAFQHMGDTLETFTLVNHAGRLYLYDEEQRLVPPRGDKTNE